MRALRIIFVLLVLAITSFAQDKLTPGVYKGTWSGPSGGGDFHRVTIKNDGKGGLTADLSFTVGGEAAVGKVASSKSRWRESKIVYDFDVQRDQAANFDPGNAQRQDAFGNLQIDWAEGQTIDEGTWKTSSQ